jgi:molybdenum cofactor cytidylyltransferase
MAEGGVAKANDGLQLGAVVLAAGASRRFGGDKRGALLDGRPLLQHVLDTLTQLQPAVTVVVLDPTAGGLDAIRWRHERRLVNPDPGRGLSSSVRMGVEACAVDPSLDGVYILLGDQPRTSLLTLAALADAVTAARSAGMVAVVPAYADGGGANPVLLLRAGFALVEEVDGDQGLGPLLAARPDQVRRVTMPGSNPDVDSPADLAALSGDPSPPPDVGSGRE